VAQKPIEGVTMKYTFDDAKAPSTRTTQYFEMAGVRAIYHDGWVACTTPPIAPWDPVAPKVDPITGYNWELYHVAEDFSQSKNLASEQPAKLAEMQLLFYAEAAKYNVLPIDNSRTERLDPALRPSLTRGLTTFTYTDGTIRVPESAGPDFKNKSFTISADVQVRTGKEDGVLITQGGLFGGFALLVRQGKPEFHYNFVDVAHYRVASRRPLAPGPHTISFAFKYDGDGLGKGGTGTLTVNGEKIAEGRIEKTIPIRVTLDESLDIGQDTGTPVSLDYDVPFKFNGTIEKVTVQLQ
jgi:arylsulfatase